MGKDFYGFTNVLGDLFMCGVNYSGNLGFGDNKVRFDPEKVPNLP